MSGGDMAGEGFILTTDDRIYWDSVYESLSYDPEQDEPDAERRKG
jgi:DNA-directed RNA polymerase subunit E'/Rpb7